MCQYEFKKDKQKAQGQTALKIYPIYFSLFDFISPLFEQTLIFFTQTNFVPRLVEIGPMVL